MGRTGHHYADLAEACGAAMLPALPTTATLTPGSAEFMMGHPEKFIDFAYRAEHEMTVEAKNLIKAFYGRAPRSPTGTAAPAVAAKACCKPSIPG